MIERCGDRQRKCDGLKRWPFHLFVESLPVILQVALFLLASGLCRHMASINIPVAGVLIGLTVLGALFYIGIVIAGASSYDCPFQIPGSVALRSLWTKIGPSLTPSALPIITILHNLGEIIQCQIFLIVMRLPHVNIRHRFRRVLEKIQLRILRVELRLPQTELNFRHPFLPMAQEDSATPQEINLWLTSKDLATIQETSANDERCISWILRSITDREALDTAIRLASTIRWFEEETDMVPPYDSIVSIFTACFGSDGKVYPWSRDRVYYSGRAILWIHALAMCKAKKFARTFPPSPTKYIVDDSEYDLRHLLHVTSAVSADDRFARLLSTSYGCTHSHLEWVSNLTLHLAWANRAALDFDFIFRRMSFIGFIENPPNRFLTWCIFLGSHVEEEVLKVQDKSCEIICFCSPSF